MDAYKALEISSKWEQREHRKRQQPFALIVATTILGKVKYCIPPLFLPARMQRSIIENKDIGLGRHRQKQNVDWG